MIVSLITNLIQADQQRRQAEAQQKEAERIMQESNEEIKEFLAQMKQDQAQRERDHQAITDFIAGVNSDSACSASNPDAVQTRETHAESDGNPAPKSPMNTRDLALNFH